jgi:hypothetical protein
MPRRTNQQDLVPHVKVAVALFLAQRSVGGSLPRGSIAAATAGFGLHRHSIRKVWRQRHDCAALPEGRRTRTPPPRHLTDDEVVERVRAVPLCQRQSLRSLAAATSIPKTTMLRYLKRSVIRRKVSRVRPTLSASHEVRRLTWALAHVERQICTYFYFLLSIFSDLTVTSIIVLTVLLYLQGRRCSAFTTCTTPCI